MTSIKTERINSELAKQITLIISQQIKDPRMCGCIVSVTKVSATPDLKYAKVYLSILSNNDEDKQSAYHTVCRSKLFIMQCLKSCLQIRHIPELSFFVDNSVDYGRKIDNILSQIKQESWDTSEE